MLKKVLLATSAAAAALGFSSGAFADPPLGAGALLDRGVALITRVARPDLVPCEVRVEVEQRSVGKGD